MKKSLFLLPFLVAATISCNNTTNNEAANAPKKDTAVAAAPAKETTPPPPMDSATMMKKWQEYMTPGDMHKMLASWDGKWTSEQTMWMDPSKPPTKGMSTCEYKMVMGGRYSQGTVKGDWMGMPFEGLSITGYDNAKKVFVSTWVDNMGTGIMHLEGTWDGGTKAITFKGKCVDPMSGKDMDVRQVVTLADDKHQTMEMYMPGPDGKEFKTMEMKITRK